MKLFGLDYFQQDLQDVHDVNFGRNKSCKQRAQIQ